MRYAVLNTVRVFLSYEIMLVFAPWSYDRHFTFSAAALFTSLRVCLRSPSQGTTVEASPVHYIGRRAANDRAAGAFRSFLQSY